MKKILCNIIYWGGIYLCVCVYMCVCVCVYIYIYIYNLWLPSPIILFTNYLY